MPISHGSLQAENSRIQAVEFKRAMREKMMESENANYEMRQKESRQRQKFEEARKASLQASNARIQFAELRNRIS